MEELYEILSEKIDVKLKDQILEILNIIDTKSRDGYLRTKVSLDIFEIYKACGGDYWWYAQKIEKYYSDKSC